MKNLLYLLLAVVLFSSCSSDDDSEEYQDFTSVQIKPYGFSFEYVKLAIKKDGVFIKIENIGLVPLDTYTNEILIENIQDSIYIFGWLDPSNRFVRTNGIKLNPNTNTQIELHKNNETFIRVLDDKDPAQYPLN